MRGHRYRAVVALGAICVVTLALTAGAINAQEGPPVDWTPEDWAALTPEEQEVERNNYPTGTWSPDEKEAWVNSASEAELDAEVDAMAAEEGPGTEFSRGVQEGAQSPFARGIYIFQNQWQDLNAAGTSLIEVFAGALVAEPCTGIVAINRTPWPPTGAPYVLGDVTIEPHELMGPITIVSSTGQYVTLAAADGSLGQLDAETGAIKWNYPLRPVPLDEVQCADM